MAFVISIFGCGLVLGALSILQAKVAYSSSFDTYYSPLWGLPHLSVNPQGSEAQLQMDQSSGAGFRSKLDYGSGLFHIRMKIPNKRTGGILTSFYLTSAPDNQEPGNHFELDYEFLGTNGTVQTNVYNNDEGHREQSFKLWFDPSADFHTYEILWNSHQIVFLVDRIPIRVFKNNSAHGITYPSKAMHIEASIWNANWAGVVDWSQAPFIAYYQDFGFQACSAQVGGDVSGCGSEQYLWNRQDYWELKPGQKLEMENYRRLYMSYDYCAYASTRKPECSFNV
ncbi:xyloglucan endotransglucosylase/hydrolase protein 3-like [Sesamum indicum]|uniref:Xyloglucan endotransglucosylase/hydrolase protein 3-like n=1 Tax=Sesamum indicum TaxID=4182 RepID=A0A6I9TBZ2_SESIN|nr:xyloglucan endotransglucosylase/hydrolase protein 3-like [Sesamum indicum]